MNKVFNLPLKLVIGLTMSLSSKRSSSSINSSSTALSSFHTLEDFFSPKLSVTLEPIYINIIQVKIKNMSNQNYIDL